MARESFLFVQNDKLSKLVFLKIDYLPFLSKDGHFYQKFARSAIRTQQNLIVLKEARSCNNYVVNP